MQRRLLLPLVLLAVVAVAAATSLPGLGHDENITAREARFAALRRAIPPDATVGFVTNVPDEPLLLDGEHYLAQYALVPAIVVRDRSRTLVVGDFYSDLPPVPAAWLEGFEAIEDLGTGVVLYRRRAETR